MLSIDKVCYEGIGEEEHLIFTVRCDDGTVLDEELEKGTDRDEAMLIAFENVTGKKVEIA